jgi:predicted amino acid dehydrogenase
VGRGLPITTGNTLSSLLTVEGVRKAAAFRGIDLPNARVAVVGATGSIGRLVSMLIAPHVGSLALLGNPKSTDGLTRCQAIAEEVYEELRGSSYIDYNGAVGNGQLVHKVRQSNHTTLLIPETGMVDTRQSEKGVFLISDRTREVLQHSDVVVLATSSDTALIGAEDLMQGAIVCDVTRPSNLNINLAKERSDIYVFEGGLAALPERVGFGPELPHFQNNAVVGCLAETILLAFQGDYRDYSVGSSLSVPEAFTMWQTMTEHGIRLAPLPHEATDIPVSP